MSVIWYIIIGIVSGFIAGKIMRGGGFGLLINLLVGIIGGLLGGWVFGLLGIATGGILGSLITSVVGAVLLFMDCIFIQKASERRVKNFDLLII